MAWHIKEALRDCSGDLLVGRLFAGDVSLAESCAIAVGGDGMIAKSTNFEGIGMHLNAAFTLRVITLSAVHRHLPITQHADLLRTALNL